MRMRWKTSHQAGVPLVELGIWKSFPLGRLLLAILPRHLERMDEFQLAGGWFLAAEEHLRKMLRSYFLQAFSKQSDQVILLVSFQ